MEHKKETYDIITINMNGDNYGKGTTDRRRNLVVSVLKRSPASVIFCQEVPPGLKEKVIENFGPGVYDFAFTDVEAAVMWRTSDFKGDRQSVKGTDPSSIKITERLQQKKSDVDVSEVRTRTAMVKLTSVKTRASFLAVSWHAKYRGMTKTNIKKALDGLICFLGEVCNCKNLSSFIIGGDFNLDTSTVDLTEHKGVEISRYKLCAGDENKHSPPRRKPGRPFIAYKDTFIFSVKVPSDERPMTGDITVSSVKQREPKNNLMDHVPVVGKLELVLPYKKPYIKQDKGELDSIFSLALSDRFLLI